MAYLDAVNGLDNVRAYKRRSLEALRVRPGAWVLDVGCGTGEDLRELAGLVGSGGRVVGVDRSETMIAQAQERTQGLPVHCQVDDAESLEFADGTFDGCRADRVLQHVDDPHQALAELVRVTRRGARVVVCDTDWGSLLVAEANKELTRIFTEFGCDLAPNGWVGRHLPGIARTAGLTDLTIEPATWVCTHLATSDALLDLFATAKLAEDEGIVPTGAAGVWTAQLQQAAAQERVAFAPTSRRALDLQPIEQDRDSKPERTDHLALLVHPAVLRALLVVFCATPLIALFINWGSKYLVHDYGIAQGDVGHYLWFPLLLLDSGAIVFGHIASTRFHASGGSPERGLIAIGGLLMALGATVPFLGSPAGSIGMAGLAMAGGGCLFALVNADMLSRIPPEAVASAAGLSAGAQSLAHIIASPLVGTALESVGSYAPIIVTLALLVVPGCIGWIVWRPPPVWVASRAMTGQPISTS